MVFACLVNLEDILLFMHSPLAREGFDRGDLNAKSENFPTTLPFFPSREGRGSPTARTSFIDTEWEPETFDIIPFKNEIFQADRLTLNKKDQSVLKNPLLSNNKSYLIHYIQTAAISKQMAYFWKS